MLSCVSYTPGFVASAQEAFDRLWFELSWERRGSTPRREYYCNQLDVPYTYGVAPFQREYLPRAWHPVLLGLKRQVEATVGAPMEVAFLNGYEDARDQLGWHADDSDSMDDARPIAIVTLGAEREIWFCPKEDRRDVTRLLLENGSLCVMAPGMQDTHLHRIPKAGFECGPRISITFRGYAGE